MRTCPARIEAKESAQEKEEEEEGVLEWKAQGLIDVVLCQGYGRRRSSTTTDSFSPKNDSITIPFTTSVAFNYILDGIVHRRRIREGVILPTMSLDLIYRYR